MSGLPFHGPPNPPGSTPNKLIVPVERMDRDNVSSEVFQSIFRDLEEWANTHAHGGGTPRPIAATLYAYNVTVPARESEWAPGSVSLAFRDDGDLPTWDRYELIGLSRQVENIDGSNMRIYVADYPGQGFASLGWELAHDETFDLPVTIDVSWESYEDRDDPFPTFCHVASIETDMEKETISFPMLFPTVDEDDKQTFLHVKLSNPSTSPLHLEEVVIYLSGVEVNRRVALTEKYSL